MTRISTNFDDDFEGGEVSMRQQHARLTTLRHKKQKPIKRSEYAVLDEIATHNAPDAIGLESYFNPTFNASRHEREWIFSYLGPFYDQKLITDVLKKVKGGKEANVYCCAAHPDTGLDLIAAKLYRPRMFRNLRNDSRYRENREILDQDGKVVHDRRLMYAVHQGTRIGKEASHLSWLEHEYRTLQILYDAGVNVPRPIACSQNTILMEHIGSVEMPAPALNEISLPEGEAPGLFDRLIQNIGRMLDCHRIHADLSAYNILYWESTVRLIDFPQAVDPRTNPKAYELFERDVVRVCQYFRKAGIRSNPVRLARDMWDQYASREKVPSPDDGGD